MPVNRLCSFLLLNRPLNAISPVHLEANSAECPPSQPALRQKMPWLKGLLWGVALAVGWGSTTPSQAAEQVTIQMGPLQQSVAIADLEFFAETGNVPSSLSLYSPLLTPDVRVALGSRLQLDPNVGNKLVEDLLYSSAGERFLNTLQVAMPNTDAAELKYALSQAAVRTDGMSILGILRAFPSRSVTIDAPSAIALVSQMNLPAWQSQTLSSVLERELTVKAEPANLPFNPSQTGPYWVWKQTMTLRDYERDRTIPVDLYWSRHTQGPLVIISHGFGADRRFLGYLAHHLASYGLTVAAVEHPASNVAWLTSRRLDSPRRSSILPASEFIDRPKDVSFVLDRLSRLNRFSEVLKDKFNTDQVSIIGHSLGGYTALALAGAPLSLKSLRQFCNDPSPVALSPADLLQCNAADLPDHSANLRDPRIVQAVLLNPVIGRLFDEASLTKVTIPTLMLASTDDSITPAVSQQLLPFTKMKSKKYLLTAIGATHLSVGDPTNLNRALTQSIFVRERSDSETEPLRVMLRGVSLAFIQQLTPEAPHYAPFLAPSYAQSFSTAGLKLRLNANLPPNFANWLKMAALPMEQLVSGTIAKSYAAQECSNRVTCLLSSLPLVMFILPGGLPLLGFQFFNLKQLDRQKRRSRQAE